jgi:hypothetical protein
MAVLIPNQFSTYELNEEEMIQGSILTITQKQVLQNHMASIASEKLAAAYDPTDHLTSIQKEAYNRGQIDLVMYILDQSDAAVDTQAQNPQS